MVSIQAMGPRFGKVKELTQTNLTKGTILRYPDGEFFLVTDAFKSSTLPCGDKNKGVTLKHIFISAGDPFKYSFRFDNGKYYGSVQNIGKLSPELFNKLA